MPFSKYEWVNYKSLGQLMYRWEKKASKNRQEYFTQLWEPRWGWKIHIVMTPVCVPIQVPLAVQCTWQQGKIRMNSVSLITQWLKRRTSVHWSPKLYLKSYANIPKKYRVYFKALTGNQVIWVLSMSQSLTSYVTWLSNQLTYLSFTFLELSPSINWESRNS